MTLRALLVALLGAGLTGCLGALESDAGEVIAGVCQNEDSDPDVSVSFSQHIQPKLHTGCGCHNPLGSGGSAIEATGFSVASYDSLRRGGQQSREGIIVPGDPCGSFLLQKLSEAPPVGARMPIYGPYWSRADMQLLADWIAEGALAN